jgi:hypothetical protein
VFLSFFNENNIDKMRETRLNKGCKQLIGANAPFGTFWHLLAPFGAMVRVSLVFQ